MNKKLIGLGVAGLLGLAGYFMLTQKTSSDSSSVTPQAFSQGAYPSGYGSAGSGTTTYNYSINNSAPDFSGIFSTVPSGSAGVPTTSQQTAMANSPSVDSSTGMSYAQKNYGTQIPISTPTSSGQTAVYGQTAKEYYLQQSIPSEHYSNAKTPATNVPTTSAKNYGAVTDLFSASALSSVASHVGL